MAERIPIPVFRFTPDNNVVADGGGGDDGGAGGNFLFSAGATFFPAIHDDAGTPRRCLYLATFGLLPGWSTIGFTEEVFIVNVDGVATNQTLAVAVAIGGVLPFGTTEFNPNLTQDGVTNIGRWIVRV